MSNVSRDFLRFLSANFWRDWEVLKESNFADDQVAKIMAKHSRAYQIWRSVPEWVKRRRGDRLPDGVLNGDEPPQRFVEKETKKVETEQKETAEVMSFSVNMLALGYAVDTVKTMAENRALREDILHQCGGKPFSMKDHPELFKKWLESRQKDIDAIVNDWKTHQPEKHMLRLAKFLSREKRKQRRLSGEEWERSEKRIKALERKLNETAKRLDGRAVKMNMVDYLRSRPQQAALRHLPPEILQLFSGLLEKQGIRVSPVTSANAKNLTSVSRESFTKDLQEALDKIEQQTKSTKSVGKLAKAVAGKPKKSKGKTVQKKTSKEGKEATTLTLKKVPTLEII